MFIPSSPYKKLFPCLILITALNGLSFAQGHEASYYCNPLYHKFYNLVITDSDFNNREFDSPVKFSGANFTQNTSFKNSKFKTNADFRMATFSKNIDFTDAQFDSNADFIYVSFIKSTYFNGDTFKGDAKFIDGRFDSETVFNGTFKKDVSFYKATFLNYNSFGHANFSKSADFTYANFDSTAYFAKTTFSKIADFENARFNSNADFHGATFSKYVNFSGAVFYKIADFESLLLTDSSYFNMDGAILPDVINLSHNLKIPNEIDLSVANFEDNSNYGSPGKKSDTKHKIFLYKTDISKIHFDYIHFKLIFNEDAAHYNINSLPFNNGEEYLFFNKVMPDDEKETIYEGALKNFKDRGQNESYKALDIEYQGFRWRAKSIIIRWFGFLDKWWWNYGYDKEWIFLWVIGLLIFFTFITLFNYRKLVLVYSFDNLDLLPNWKGRGQRLWAAFFYTCTIFFPLSLKLKNIKKIRSAWLVYIAIVYLSGLLCVGYMANFVLAK